MCWVRWPFLAKVLSQWLHAFSFIFSWTSLMCWVRWLFLAKVLSQWLHAFSFISSWLPRGMVDGVVLSDKCAWLVDFSSSPFPGGMADGRLSDDCVCFVFSFSSRNFLQKSRKSSFSLNRIISFAFGWKWLPTPRGRSHSKFSDGQASRFLHRVFFIGRTS